MVATGLACVPARAQSLTTPASGPASGSPAGGVTGSGVTGSGVTGSGVTGSGSALSGAGSAIGSTGPIAAPSGVLPETGGIEAGNAVRVGDLQGALSSVSGGPQLLAPGNPDERRYTITPSISLTEEYTDNALGSASGGFGTGASRSRGDFITVVQPGISVTADTVRLQGSLSYAPEITLYAQDGSQDRIGHDLQARLLAALVPGTVFVDLRASAGLQSATGLQGPAGTTSQSRSQTTQDLSVSVAPYAVHRFGPWGTGEIGVGLSRTTQSGLQDFGSGNTVQPGLANSLLARLQAQEQGLANGNLGSGASQDTTSYSGHAAFSTGEAFGRYNGTALAYATEYDGNGVLQGARRNTATIDNGYAVTRTVTALARLGWEDIRYSGTNPQHISDPVWDVGVRLLPNAFSTVTLRYGHHDGFDSLLVDAAYQPTARTRVYLRYSSGLTTQDEELQNALATSDVDALGNPVDHGTGAPLVGADNFFGAQNDLYKVKQVSLTGVLDHDRDVFTATLNGQDRRLVSASGLVGDFAGASSLGSNKGLYGSLAWSHALRPNLTGNLYGQVGLLSADGPPKSTEHLVVGSASLAYTLTRTLSGQVQYSYTQTTSNVVGNSASENLVLVTLLKSF